MPLDLANSTPLKTPKETVENTPPQPSPQKQTQPDQSGMTLEQFGQNVKKKYPQYNSMSDSDVANKVIAKYPQYKSRIRGGLIQETKQPNQPNGTMSFLGGLKKFGDISGKVLGGVSGAVGWLAKAAGGEIAKTAIQMPRAFAAGVSELSGNEQAASEYSKPVNVPILGEVKGLSARPGDVEKFGTQTAEETAGQAVGMAGEALGARGIGGVGESLASKTIPASLKVAEGIGTGVTMGSLGGASEALKENKSAEDVAKSTLKGGVIGGITGGATTALASGIQSAAGKMSRGAVTRLIKPISSNFKFGKDPVGAFINEGFTGNSVEELADQVATRKNEVGSGIDAAIQKAEQADPSKTINIQDAVSSIDEQIKKSAYSPDDIAELKRVRGMLTDIRDVQNGESIVSGQRNIESLRPSEVQQIKRIVGDNASWTSKASDKVNSFTKKLYGMLDKKIDGAVPEAAELNNRYGELLSLDKATQRAVEQKMAKEGRGDLYDIGAAGTAVAALFHGDYKMAAGVVGADILRKLTNSPAAASRLSALLSKASEADLASIATKYPNFANALKTLGRDGLMKLAEQASK